MMRTDNHQDCIPQPEQSPIDLSASAATPTVGGPLREVLKENVEASAVRSSGVEDFHRMPHACDIRKSKFTKLVAYLPPRETFSKEELVARWAFSNYPGETKKICGVIDNLTNRGVLKKVGKSYQANPQVYEVYGMPARHEEWSDTLHVQSLVRRSTWQGFIAIIDKVAKEWSTNGHAVAPVGSPYTDSPEDQKILFTSALRKRSRDVLGSHWTPSLPPWAVDGLFRSKLGMPPNMFARTARAHLAAAFAKKIATVFGRAVVDAAYSGKSIPQDTLTGLVNTVATLCVSKSPLTISTDVAGALNLPPQSVSEAIHCALGASLNPLLLELAVSPLLANLDEHTYARARTYLAEGQSEKQATDARQISKQVGLTILHKLHAITPLIRDIFAASVT